jgi:DNA mismatch repair protein MutL
MIKSTNTIQGIKAGTNSKLGKLVCWIKTRFKFSRECDFSFESEEVTGSLFNDGEVEQTVHSAYQFIKKYIVSSIKSGMVVDQQRAHQRVCMSNFDKHDGQSSFKSAIIIPFGFVLFLC